MTDDSACLACSNVSVYFDCICKAAIAETSKLSNGVQMLDLPLAGLIQAIAQRLLHKHPSCLDEA